MGIVIDFSNAPEGATHYMTGDDCGVFLKKSGDDWFFINHARWDNGKWKLCNERINEESLYVNPHWKAAVDALKAGDTSYSAENVSVNTNYVSHASSPDDAECKIIRSEWNGEGLPPTGVEFEWRYGDHAWKIGVALYIGSVYVILKARDDEQHYYLRDMQFRPMRTPEQIAAEERSEGVDGIRQAVSKSPNCKAHGLDWDVACAIYDAGYRKQK